MPRHAVSLRARFARAMGLPAAATVGACALAAACDQRAEPPVTMTPGESASSATAPPVTGPPPIEPVQLPGQCAAPICENFTTGSLGAEAFALPAPFTGCHRVHPLNGAQFSPARTLAMRASAPAACCYVTFSPCAPSHVVVPGRPLRRSRAAARTTRSCALLVPRSDWI